MDEIVIEEKKYVSSKQAAKKTGYAKDYVGQLCREGRVPARLVGRNWYVLEAAIHDHRFGKPEIEPRKLGREPAAVPEPSWECPRYEADTPLNLMSVNKLRVEASPEVPATEDSHDLAGSWQEWFERIAATGASAEYGAEPDVRKSEISVPTEREEVIENTNEAPEAIFEPVEEENPTEVPIRLHAIYHQPPEELLPRRNIAVRMPSEEQQESEDRIFPQERALSHRVGSILSIAGSLCALIMLSLAFIGSGYADQYIVSNKQVQMLAGVAVYELPFK